MHLKCLSSVAGGPALIGVNMNYSQAGGALRCQSTFYIPLALLAHLNHPPSPRGP